MWGLGQTQTLSCAQGLVLVLCSVSTPGGAYGMLGIELALAIYKAKCLTTPLVLSL